MVREWRLVGSIGLLLAALAVPLSAVVVSSPGSVVTDFYYAANDGRYTDAEKLFSTQALAAIAAGQGGFKAYCDVRTKAATMATVEIVQEDIRGEGATVTARVAFKDGSSTDSVTELVREGNEWRIAVGPK